MKIGIDVDGVLANFTTAYQDLHIKIAGDKFNGDRFPPMVPQSWNWVNEFYSYTEEETKEVWKAIKSDPWFWTKLQPLEGMYQLQNWLQRRTVHHEIYFITDRPGITTKLQTERWFVKHGISGATVMVSKHKGLSCAALELDMYVDDRGDNIVAVQEQSPNTKAFLLDRLYNAQFLVENRIQHVIEMLPA